MNKPKEPKSAHVGDDFSEKEQVDTTISTDTEQAVESKKNKNKNQEHTKESSAKRIQELEIEIQQLKEYNLRLLAEYDNYRKRSIREKAELIKTGGESVLVGMLSVVDDFERGMAAIPDSSDTVAIKEGLDLIYKKLIGFLKQHGVAAMETQDQNFDTDLHEAITSIPAPDEKLKGKVVDCVQKGYFLHDKVIRFAKVVVGS